MPSRGSRLIPPAPAVRARGPQLAHEPGQQRVTAPAVADSALEAKAEVLHGSGPRLPFVAHQLFVRNAHALPRESQHFDFPGANGAADCKRVDMGAFSSGFDRPVMMSLCVVGSHAATMIHTRVWSP